MDNWILLFETYVFFSLIFIVCYYAKLNEYSREIKDMKKAEYHTTRMMNHVRAKKDTINEDTIRFSYQKPWIFTSYVRSLRTTH